MRLEPKLSPLNSEKWFYEEELRVCYLQPVLCALLTNLVVCRTSRIILLLWATIGIIAYVRLRRLSKALRPP